MIAYKVFYKTDSGKLYSSNGFNNSSGLVQEYFEGVTNYPKFDFPIFCFENLDEAFKFKRFSSLLKVYEVEGEKSRRKISRMIDPCAVYQIKNEKEFNHFIKSSQVTVNVLNGTVFMNSIRLIMEIENESSI